MLEIIDETIILYSHGNAVRRRVGAISKGRLGD
jgi:hypothetical protein